MRSSEVSGDGISVNWVGGIVGAGDGSSVVVAGIAGDLERVITQESNFFVYLAFST